MSSRIDRFRLPAMGSEMLSTTGGEWIRYSDHREEVERLRSKLDTARRRARRRDRENASTIGESIWLEYFMHVLQTSVFTTVEEAADQAHKVLDLYHKRRPR